MKLTTMGNHHQYLIIITSLLLFIELFYTERFDVFLSFTFRSNHNLNLKFNPSSSNNTEPELDESNNNKKAQEIHHHKGKIDECNVGNGKWVYDKSKKSLYSDTSCPYISRTFSCLKNGRIDSHYLYWQWQPEHCTLPRFDPKLALEKLKGKRVLFIGDSLQQNQWESFICMVEWIIPQTQKSMKRGIHSVFTAKEYNATIEFYWAPMLVESNSDSFKVKDPNKRIVKVDSIMDRAKHWIGVDILVFNTYIWWIHSPYIKVIKGSFANGEEYEVLDKNIAYKLGLRTWANWVDSTINPNKTRVFFTTMSPTHTKSADWGNKNGVKCFNENKPVMKKNHWGSGSDKSIMSVLSKVVNKMKIPVTYINITQMSE